MVLKSISTHIFKHSTSFTAHRIFQRVSSTVIAHTFTRNFSLSTRFVFFFFFLCAMELLPFFASIYISQYFFFSTGLLPRQCNLLYTCTNHMTKINLIFVFFLWTLLIIIVDIYFCLRLVAFGRKMEFLIYHLRCNDSKLYQYFELDVEFQVAGRKNNTKKAMFNKTNAERKHFRPNKLSVIFLWLFKWHFRSVGMWQWWFQLFTFFEVTVLFSSHFVCFRCGTTVRSGASSKW